MKFLWEEIPESTGASAVYPYSSAIAKAFTFAPVYEEEDGEPIRAYKRVGDKIHVPRNAVPMGSRDDRRAGVPVKIEFNATARNAEQARVWRETNNLLAKGESFIVSAPTGCHAKDTMIMLHSGDLIAVQDIKVGDKLMGPDSQPREVLELHTGVDRMYSILPEYAPSFSVNGGHILSLLDDRDNVVNISVDTFLGLDEQTQSQLYLYRAAVDFSPRGNPLIDPHYYGIYAAKCAQYDVSIGEYLGDSFAIIKYGSIETRLQFLEGVISSYHDTGVHTKSKEFAAALLNIASSIGCRARSKTYLSTVGYLHTVYLDLAQSAKHQKYPFDVVRGLSAAYYGFTVDGDNLYLMSDFTVTHNSGKTVSAAAAIASVGRKALVITTKDDIKQQWVETFLKFTSIKPNDIGQIKGDVHDTKNKKVVIASIQSICKEGRYPAEVYQGYGLVIVDECFHPSHELLTTVGWVQVSQITVGHMVAQVDAYTGEVSYVHPERIVSRHFEGELVRISGANCSLLATPNHEHLVLVDGVPVKIPYRNFTPADNMLQRHAVGGFEGEPDVINTDLTCVADYWGSSMSSKLSTIKLTHSRSHYQQLLQCLTTQTDFPSHTFFAIDKSDADLVQSFAILAGFAAKLEAKYMTDNGVMYKVSWSTKGVSKTTGLKKDWISYHGPVHCVTVPMGNVVTRHNGKVTVTGNCHRIGATEFNQAMYYLDAKLRVGYSATPVRKDGRDVVLASHIGPVKVLSTQANMIPKIYTVETRYQIQKVKYVKAGRTMGVDGELVDSVGRNKLIAQCIGASYRNDRKIIMMTSLVRHLEIIHGLCLVEGMPKDDIAYYYGGITQAQRETNKSKRVLLATYKYCAEGTDIADLDTLLLATPRSDIIQIVGRIVRVHPDKKHPIVFDFVDGGNKIIEGYAWARRKYYKAIGAQISAVNF